LARYNAHNKATTNELLTL